MAKKVKPMITIEKIKLRRAVSQRGPKFNQDMLALAIN